MAPKRNKDRYVKPSRGGGQQSGAFQLELFGEPDNVVAVEDANPTLAEQFGEQAEWKSPPMPTVVPAKNGQVLGLFFGYKYFCSNFHSSPFRLDDHDWSCVEHYYVHKKLVHFGERELADQVRDRAHLGAAKMKQIGTQAVDRADQASRDSWRERRQQVMMTAVRAKFAQNEALAEALLATGRLELVEASNDKYWGNGLKLEPNRLEQHADVNMWRYNDGQNKLGVIIMLVRDELVNLRAMMESAKQDATPHPSATAVVKSPLPTASAAPTSEHNVVGLCAPREENAVADGSGKSKKRPLSMTEKLGRLLAGTHHLGYNDQEGESDGGDEGDDSPTETKRNRVQ